MNDVMTIKMNESDVSPNKKRQRCNLELSQKLEIINYRNQNPNVKQGDIADHFSNLYNLKIGRSTICEILKDKYKFIQNENVRPPDCKRLKQPRNPLLEKCLMFWYSYVTLKHGKISDDKLRDQAKEIGKEMKITDFNYSFGWISKFKKRYKLHKSYIDKYITETACELPVHSVTQMIEWIKEVNEASLNESDFMCFENNQSLNESVTTNTTTHTTTTTTTTSINIKKEVPSSGDSCSNDDYASMNSVDECASSFNTHHTTTTTTTTTATTNKDIDLNDAKQALERLHKFCEQSEYFDSNDLRFLIRLKSKLDSIN